MAEKHFTLRINESDMEKFKYVSSFDGRSANQQLIILARIYVARYERKNGPITQEQLLLFKQKKSGK